MKAKLSAPWAQTPSTNRREPTGSEIATGFPCGDLDQKLFNELVYRLSGGEAEIINVITAAGLTPNETILTQLRDALYVLFPRKIVGTLTLYVRTDGNNANNGSANTAGSAFATIQGALDYAAQNFSLAGKTLIIQLGNAGTYANFTMNTSAGSITVLGNTGTPTSYVISGNGVVVSGGHLTLNGVQVTNTSTDKHTVAATSAALSLQNVVLHCTQTNPFAHVAANSGGSITLLGGVSVTSSMGYVLQAAGGQLGAFGTLTVPAAGNYTGAVVSALSTGSVQFGVGFSWINSTSGKRYEASLNGVINTFGGGANFIPGSIAGTTSSGGQYA